MRLTSLKVRKFITLHKVQLNWRIVKMEKETLVELLIKHTNKPAEVIEKMVSEIHMQLFGALGTGGKFGESNIPIDYANTTMLNSVAKLNQSSIYSTLDKYCQTFQRIIEPDGKQIKSLYLYSSESGTGKTTTACAVANEFMIYEWKRSLLTKTSMEAPPVYFFDVNEFQLLYNEANRQGMPNYIREEANVKYKDMRDLARTAPLVVFDDIGVRSPTEAFLGDLHAVMNFRVTNRMINVYTSNIKLSELDTMLGQRLADRIRQQTIDITFGGTSNRGVHN